MISFKELGNMGRLGNQLFQIATTVALALRNDDQYVFPIWSEENNFNLWDCYSNKIESKNIHIEPYFHYSPIKYRPDLNLQGFYQSEKYFDDCKDIIHNLLTPRIGFAIKYDTTAIHVRRGDYLNLKKEYAQLDLEYYAKAIKETKTSKYLVFSDDISWCKENFKGEQYEFSEGKSPVEDLALMLACENQIIANSSFSWWGAYLNKNPSKIVVAPKNWFGPALNHDTKDLIPESWLKI
jgi:hypothetical protein